MTDDTTPAVGHGLGFRNGSVRRLTQAWTAAEAALPLGWQVSALYRFGEFWIALGEWPAFDDYLSGSGRFAEQALNRLSDGLWERRGRQSGG